MLEAHRFLFFLLFLFLIYNIFGDIFQKPRQKKKRKPRLTSVSYSHLWGTDQRPVTVISLQKTSCILWPCKSRINRILR